MDGMPLVLIAIVVAAGVVAIVALVLDMMERRRYEQALRGERGRADSAADRNVKSYESRETVDSAR